MRGAFVERAREVQRELRHREHGRKAHYDIEHLRMQRDKVIVSMLRREVGVADGGLDEVQVRQRRE